MKNFEDLIVWQKAIKLAKAIYRSTSSFPKNEIFGITNQVRRAVTSVSCNIAEGFGRRQPRDKEHFYVMALGSLLETKSLVYLCNELSYINKQETESLLEKITEVHKLLNALITAQKGK